MAYDPKPEVKIGRPLPTMCCWNDYGEVCNYRGVLSPGNLGAGPWYCREHFYKLRGYPDMEKEKLKGNAVPMTPMHSFAVDEIQKRLKTYKEKTGEEGWDIT